MSGAPSGLRLLADDLTGALDSAAAFGAGLPVFLEQAPSPDEAAAGPTAVAVATRDLPPADLPARLAGLMGWFRDGVPAFKKVDSLLRGNTVAECTHLAVAGGFDALLFAPAFPGQGRHTVGGVQWAPVPGDLGAAPQATSGSIIDAFAAQGLAATVTVGVRPPAWAAVARQRGTAPEVWVPDVRSDADLAALARTVGAMARQGTRRWMWCGSAGLAQALAVTPGTIGADLRRTALPLAGSDAAASASTDTGRVLMLGASHHAVVRRQWQALRAAQPAALHVVAGEPAAFEAACTALAGTVPLAALELSPAGVLTAAEAAGLLARQLARLVATARRPDTLLVVGGDSLLALCRATGTRSLRTAPARRAGWGCARLVGGHWDGVTCHSRSGAFGGDEDLQAMLTTVGGPRR